MQILNPTQNLNKVELIFCLTHKVCSKHKQTSHIIKIHEDMYEKIYCK